MRCPALLAGLLALPLFAQQFEFWPGAQYDPSIPTIRQVLGHEPGEWIAPPEEIHRYFDALAKAAPERVRLYEYAHSWEGRRLVYAVIASPESINRLDEIKAAMQKLYDPRKTTPEEARKLIETLPLVLNLSYGVHGNEISSPDSAMLTAYHLLAAKNDKIVQQFYRDTVLLIDPTQNPDGRNRFVQNFQSSEGIEPDPSPVSAERAEPWPGGRTNHYYFDMNRDWFAMTQPETIGRIHYLREWWPVVVVDLHEMGTDSSYFFAPGSEPFNPHVLKSQLEWSGMFGRNNAKWFDQLGYTYFTREVYDEFYPGYGSGWPWFYGGIGMTYENASVRGLAARRSDGSLYLYRDSVRKHFIAAISTCETVSDNRRKLLEDFYDYHVTAIDEGKKETVKEYILPRRGDVSAVDKLAHVLAEQGIEVNRAQAAFQSGGKQYPEGSYLIPLAQPRKRYVRSLLDKDVPLTKEFAAEQERRRKKNLPGEMYDVTGWSLPLLYNVECVGLEQAVQTPADPVAGPYEPRGSVSGVAKLAYLVPWGTQASGRFLTGALRAGLKVLSVNKQFTQNGRVFPSGTVVVLVKDNGETVHDAVERLARISGAEAIATDTGWTEGGINFGSSNTFHLKAPVIAMLWDSPAFSASAGNARYVLERQFNYPVTIVRSQLFSNADLSQFNVIILPGGQYGALLTGALGEKLHSWVRNGGTLIAIGSAMTALSSLPNGLLAVQQEGLAPDAGKDAGKDAAKPAESAKPATPPATPSPAGAGPAQAPGKIFTKPEDLRNAIQPEHPMPNAVAGVLARANVDPETWVTAGVSPTLHLMLEGNLIFSPIRIDRGVNAVTFAAPDELVESGYLWDENRKQLAYKPAVVVQNEARGWVVGFVTDPTFRGFMDGENVLFLNAVFRAPGAAHGFAQQE
jgi:hypothetical protein